VGENKRKNLNLNLRIFFLSRNPLLFFGGKTLSRPPHPPWPFGLPSSVDHRLSLSRSSTHSRPPFPEKKPEATLLHKPRSRHPPQTDLLPLRAKHHPPSPLRPGTRETKRATAAPAPPLASQRLFFPGHPRETSPSPLSASLSSQPVFTASEPAAPSSPVSQQQRRGNILFFIFCNQPQQRCHYWRPSSLQIPSPQTHDLPHRPAAVLLPPATPTEATSSPTKNQRLDLQPEKSRSETEKKRKRRRSKSKGKKK